MEITKNRLIMIKENNFEYNKKISCGEIAIDFIKNIIQLQNEPEETLYLIGLDNKNNIVGFLEIGRGTINGVTTTQREIFKRALLMNCSKIILTHNHPTGDPTPSKIDLNMTKETEKLAQLFGIQLLDHIIIGDNKNYSIMAKKEI